MAGFSLQSRRKHKALGRKPQDRNNKGCEPAKRATDSERLWLSPVSRARMDVLFAIPGACAPGFMLSLAPRALFTPASQAEEPY